MKSAKLAVVVLTVFLLACSNAPAPDAASGTATAEVAVPDSPSPTSVGSDVKAPAAAPASAAKAPAPAKIAEAAPTIAPAASATTVVPAGTLINVTLIDAISSEKNQVGDQFTASLSEPLVIDGKTVAEKGTKVQGRIVDAVSAGRVKGVASMRIVLTSLIAGEKAIPIVTETLVGEAQATKGRDAAVVGGAAGVGAAIGALAGGKKGAGIGAIIGGGSGAGAVLATKGNEVEYASESKLTFTLQKSTELPTIKKKIS